MKVVSLLVVLAVSVAASTVLVSPTVVYAEQCEDGYEVAESDLNSRTIEEICAERGGPANGTGSSLEPPPKSVNHDCRENTQLTEDNCGILKYVKIFSAFLSAGAGVVVAIMIIVGGIQYSMAGDNPQAVAAAKQKIKNALIALFAYIFMFAFLQWIVPGGLF